MLFISSGGSSRDSVKGRLRLSKEILADANLTDKHPACRGRGVHIEMLTSQLL
jgi:hypothetical protein